MEDTVDFSQLLSAQGDNKRKKKEEKEQEEGKQSQDQGTWFVRWAHWL